VADSVLVFGVVAASLTVVLILIGVTGKNTTPITAQFKPRPRGGVFKKLLTGDNSARGSYGGTARNLGDNKEGFGESGGGILQRKAAKGYGGIIFPFWLVPG
jgi:hypothetical protein